MNFDSTRCWKRAVADMVRSVYLPKVQANPRRSISLTIQIIGPATRSTSRFMKTLLPCRVAAFSSSTPATRKLLAADFGMPLAFSRRDKADKSVSSVRPGGGSPDEPRHAVP